MPAVGLNRHLFLPYLRMPTVGLTKPAIYKCRAEELARNDKTVGRNKYPHEFVYTAESLPTTSSITRPWGSRSEKERNSCQRLQVG